MQCANCGEENSERAKFCSNCATPLAAATPAAEVRKTVSVLFADIVSSTSRSEQTDPESTRRMLARYFDAMRRVVERHGGIVEKFIGDAVMAVFGIPVVHEDDALRAVRAALEFGTAVAALNDELSGGGWPPLSLRIGVNTGEVVAGDPAASQTLVTGDAVNVAARLEQAANPGEVIVGADTYRLVRDAIEAEPIPALELKGKAERVEAYRLLGLKEQQPIRRHDTPLVDRQSELRILGEAFDRAKREDACHLFTLLGSAGVGKSRLIHEFLQQVGAGAQVLRARCLPYGEGITFWPIVELAQAVAGINPSDAAETARGKLGMLLEGASERDAIVEGVEAAIGLSDSAVPSEEIFWGVRKLLEAIAQDKPLVVVIDDLHWAEPTMLDLVEHIADWSHEAPILLMVIARPEMLDARPHWGGGKMNATTILLEPLTAEDSAELVGNLINDVALARAVQGRIGETAEGNPLFVEELVAMLVDEGVLRRVNGGWQSDADLSQISVPPTVSALVSARLDRLEPSERDLIGRASVVGKVFQRSAVTELSPPERRDDLGSRLMTLVRKELVRPDRSGTTGDEAFRFRHILVRDAAYGSLPKEQRADLHARFAAWLEGIAGERQREYEEVMAYHLEQAHRYRAELGLADELTRKLAADAATHLGAAGSRAMARNDSAAATNLLSRTAALLVDDRQRGEVLMDLAHMAANAGDFSRAAEAFDEVRAAARLADDDLLEMRADLEWMGWRAMIDPSWDEPAMLRLAERVEARALELGEKSGAIAAAVIRAQVYLNQCRWMDQLGALEEVRELLDPAEDPRLWLDNTAHICNALQWGPVPAAEAIERIEAANWGTDSSHAAGRGGFTAPLFAMLGRFDEARAQQRQSIEYAEERGLRMRVGVTALRGGAVEDLAGDLEAADRTYAEGIAILQSLGETGVRSTLAAMHANVLYRLGRRQEMEAAVRLARETGAADDIATQVDWRGAAAKLAADDGRLADAERLVGEAIELVEPTDFLELRGRAFEALAHVEARAGRPDRWKAALDRALAEHEQKGNLVAAARVRVQHAAGPPEPVASA
ncbi:MAG: adenylate/guanylate cyclase domain-containing protein [Nocardioidaceae bacterium]